MSKSTVELFVTLKYVICFLVKIIFYFLFIQFRGFDTKATANRMGTIVNRQRIKRVKSMKSYTHNTMNTTH